MTSLPLDVLHKIFSFLNWSEVQMCAAVCKGWEATANEACELKWKEECKQDYAQIYQEAYRKSRLSWAQLYKSLRLWPHIKATKIYLHYSDFLDGGDGYSAITGRQTKKIQVLKNGIIGYPICMVNESGDSDSSEGRRINLKKLFRGHRSYCNTIVYYDPETLQEISRRDLDFEFNNYEENDDLIVLRRHNNEDGYSLCIITKANQLIHNIGSMVQYTWGDISKFYLVGNKVFFLSKDYKIWMSKLVLDNGEAAIQTAHFANYNLFPELDGIEAFSFINDNQVNVLTSRGNIFSIVEQKLVKLGRVKKEIDNRNEVVAMLKQYGFQWSTPAVYKWICGHDIIDGDWVAITHLKHVTVHSHDCVVFIGTSVRTLHVYYNPYVKGQLRLYNRKPTLKIDLNDHVPLDDEEVPSEQRRIMQIDVMEIPNGHRVLLLYCQRLVAIEFHNDPTKRPLDQYENVASRPRCDLYRRIN